MSTANFLEYLADKEEIDATEELLNTEGFRAAFRKGQKSVEQGKVTPVEQLKRKY
jgi:4-hydroxyphenylpyruvate dioxygenase-like putative hemolysin